MVNLNREFVIAKIESLGLRRWWLAEQLGINRRTLHRWLNGQTQHISDTAATKLAANLGCSVAELSEPEDTASHQDQLEEAKALAASNLLANMSPGHEFALYTQLAKGMLVPGLDKQALGQLYMNIALAHFRQSELDEAVRYAERAQKIATEIGDEHLWVRANMQLSYRRYLDGDA